MSLNIHQTSALLCRFVLFISGVGSLQQVKLLQLNDTYQCPHALTPTDNGPIALSFWLLLFEAEVGPRGRGVILWGILWVGTLTCEAPTQDFAQGPADNSYQWLGEPCPGGQPQTLHMARCFIPLKVVSCLILSHSGG